MTTRLCLLFILAAAFLSLSSPIAFAHTEAKDGRISAFLHVDPTDNPQPRKINNVHFYFNDQDFRFSMEGCDCFVKVLQGEKILYDGRLPAAARRVGLIKVFLPVNNYSYDVKVSGTPKTAGFFQPFNLKFDIDVGHPPPQPPAPPDHRKYLLAGLPVLAGAGYWLFRRRHSRHIIQT